MSLHGDRYKETMCLAARTARASGRCGTAAVRRRYEALYSVRHGCRPPSLRSVTFRAAGLQSTVVRVEVGLNGTANALQLRDLFGAPPAELQALTLDEAGRDEGVAAGDPFFNGFDLERREASRGMPRATTAAQAARARDWERYEAAAFAGRLPRGAESSSAPRHPSVHRPALASRAPPEQAVGGLIALACVALVVLAAWREESRRSCSVP